MYHPLAGFYPRWRSSTWLRSQTCLQLGVFGRFSRLNYFDFKTLSENHT